MAGFSSKSRKLDRNGISSWKLKYKLLYVEENLVGIEKNVDEIESWLQDPSPDAAILFIHGMGGIGKTIISKCILNSNYHYYDANCFLANIHETSSQPGGLLSLQKQLVSAVLISEKEEVICNLDDGTAKITHAICNKKVLLVLDDITTRQQLIALLGPQHFYGGSKVIITTRHKWLLNDFRVHPKGTSKVEGLILDMQRIHTNKKSFKFGAIEKMKNLKLLQLDYATFCGSYKKLPKKLRLLRWHGFPFKSIPPNVPLHKLVVLDLRYSKLKQVWDGFKVIELGFLKILNLSYSMELIKTPNFVTLPNLESLLLEGCLSLTKVCESIRYLERLVLFDISDCRSLKEIPCLPKSLVSLKMRGFSNLGGIGRVQCMESFSLSSRLANIDISYCNLFDKSFPEDWSNFILLKSLDISGNHITSLPSCVKSIPSLEVLNANKCSHLQLVLDVPKSVTNLFLCDNKSLEIVQPTPIRCELQVEGCEKLRAVKGLLKRESIKNVDKKVIRYLGLESIFEDIYMEKDSIKVTYEFGIYSTYVIGDTLPCYLYKESGSKISFKVPSHPNGSKVSALNVCFRATESPYFVANIQHVWDVKLENKTKDMVWYYCPGTTSDIKRCSGFIWLSLWRTGNLLDDGDEIVFSSKVSKGAVNECCVNLLYDDDNDDGGEEIDEEKKDNHWLNDNHISWIDKLAVEVSHFVGQVKIGCFQHFLPGFSVERWRLLSRLV
ncbi:hypothetical protein QVD17_30063 [Tagetes erecta]|uniref:NB-ARC domain-containing protein n=1 Tax=Tagetes erecta TaxID=13708 RepID=A0AAD8NLW9_TARER|nr:hypothetical protein QVD17_30063 [Tagetes erecta]